MKKENTKLILFVLLAIGGLSYFGYSFLKDNTKLAQQIKPVQIQQEFQQETKSLDFNFIVEREQSINKDEIKEWIDLFFYFTEKGLALVATGIGIYLSIKQTAKNKSAKKT